MLSTFHKIFNLTLAFSAVISSWTMIILLSNTSFNAEIIQLLNNMYLNQKDFVYNVRGLSLLLVKDANERLDNNQLDITQLKNAKDDLTK